MQLGFHPSHILGGMPTDEIMHTDSHDRAQALASIGDGLGFSPPLLPSGCLPLRMRSMSILEEGPGTLYGAVRARKLHLCTKFN